MERDQFHDCGGGHGIWSALRAGSDNLCSFMMDAPTKARNHSATSQSGP